MNASPLSTIEDARPGDLPAVLSILNHYISNDHCTFDTEPWSVAQKQAWFDAFQADNPYRLLVARADGQLLGYAHSGAWRPKKAYQMIYPALYTSTSQSRSWLVRYGLSSIL